MKIKEMPKEDRPYEKLEKFGSSFLTDSELLAIILRSGYKNLKVIDLSRKILNDNSNFLGLYKKSIEELKKIKGVGRVKALQIKALLEISRRINIKKIEKKHKGNSARIIAKRYIEKFKYAKKEMLVVIYLDSKLNIIAEEKVSVGLLNSSLVHPREIFINAIKKSSYGIIMLHNHPSGDPTPSQDDIETTKRIKKASEIIGIKLIDHLIVGNEKYISLKNENII